MNGVAASGRSPLKFFGLLFALAAPIWLLSLFVGVVGSLKIPVTDLMLAFVPMTAAAILIYREEGLPGVAALFRRAFDFRGIGSRKWLLATVLLAPLIYLVTAAVMHLAGRGAPVEPRLAILPLLFALFFLLAVGEEAGWTGYATDPLQARWGALGASLILAVPWWLGHLPSIVQIGGAAADIAWWIPGAIGLRVLIVWLYSNTGGSLFAAVLFHALLNLGRIVTYPPVGAHYDTAYQAVGYSVAFVMAVVVVLVWGPKALAR